MRLPLIIHERIGHWARQLRPRVEAWPVKLIETRPGDDVATMARRSACPILVVDLGDRPKLGLEAIDQAYSTAPLALILALNSSKLPEVDTLARELGASRVLSGSINPPDVMTVLERWLPIAQKRAEADGWAEDRVPELEPWEELLESLNQGSCACPEVRLVGATFVAPGS